jgi:L-ascorbate metabolism protein UlaG (beta-lactamase superfamily)
MAGRVLLVDPMLDDASAGAAVPNTENDRRNPLVGLPVAIPHSRLRCRSFCQNEDTTDLGPTMDAADVLDTAQSAPATQVVAVHMEAINHCLLSRDALRKKLAGLGLAAYVAIPADGESLTFD